MKAKEFVNLYGKSLIGTWIYTEPMGEYPGGHAIVTEIYPDKNAKDIVMNINHPTFGEIGVFDYEDVSFYMSINNED